MLQKYHRIAFLMSHIHVEYQYVVTYIIILQVGTARVEMIEMTEEEDQKRPSGKQLRLTLLNEGVRPSSVYQIAFPISKRSRDHHTLLHHLPPYLMQYYAFCFHFLRPLALQSLIC